jgi:hypothetical protein
MNTQETTGNDALRARVGSGASWFYWIAGLSVVNSILAATGSNWGFLAGLGVTQLIDGVGQAMGTWAKPLTLVLDGVVASIFVAIGWWAQRRVWVYLAGMILFVLDTILITVAGDRISVAFHGLVLFFLWGGLAAKRSLNEATPTAGEAIPAPAGGHKDVDRAA